jgi:hypothetical protein
MNFSFFSVHSVALFLDLKSSIPVTTQNQTGLHVNFFLTTTDTTNSQNIELSCTSTDAKRTTTFQLIPPPHYNITATISERMNIVITLAFLKLVTSVQDALFLSCGMRQNSNYPATKKSLNDNKTGISGMIHSITSSVTLPMAEHEIICTV